MAIFLSSDQIEYTDSQVNPAVTTTSPAFTYGPNISDFGGTSQVAYAKHDSSAVELGGDIKSSVNLSAGAVLLTMCLDLSPKYDEDALIVAGGALIPVSVSASTGQITIVSGSVAAGAKISLNNIVYLQRDALIPVDSTIVDDTSTNIALYTRVDSAANSFELTTDGSYVDAVETDSNGIVVSEWKIDPANGLYFNNGGQIRQLRKYTFDNTALANGFVVYGGSWGTVVKGKITTDNVVVLQGMITRSTGWANGTVVMTLPPELCPKEQLIFEQNSMEGARRVDVCTDGRITTDASDGWLSLSGISYSID